MSPVLPPVKKVRTARRDSASSSPGDNSTSSPAASQGASRVPGKKSKASKSASDTSSSIKPITSAIDPSIIDISSGDQLPSLNSEHRVKDKCPCNRSISSWKIDCSKCHQYWHLDCLSMTGLDKAAINRMTSFLCPFCFVSPVPTIQANVDICHVCRNTLSLQQTNIEYEASVAMDKIRNMSQCCKVLQNIDFEEFGNKIDTLMQFDQRLRHILLSENSLKGLDSEIRGLTELLTSSSLTSPPPNTALTEMSKSMQSYDRSFESITDNIAKLQNDLHLLSSKPVPAAPASSACESSDQLLKSISEKIDTLCANEPEISAGIEQLKESISSIQFTRPAPSHSDPGLPVQRPCPSVSPIPAQPLPLPHDQKPVTDSIPDFIGVDEAEKLTCFLESCTFKSENGHSVFSVGVPYEYTGSKSSINVPPIPDELESLFEKINSIQIEVYKSKYPDENQLSPPLINSCLVNKYEGPTSYLPRHSDREVTVHPESSIFTVSLGQTCDIKFTERDSDSEVITACPDRSLYRMSRRSQEVFEHQIEQGSISSGVRYSLTFRAVDWKNKNSTCIIGDSNTGFLCFGSCKRRTFGELMPGQKFWSPRIDDIDPKSCMGYASVVLLCGINDIRQPQ